jgi:hypothetical protein
MMDYEEEEEEERQQKQEEEEEDEEEQSDRGRSSSHNKSRLSKHPSASVSDHLSSSSAGPKRPKKRKEEFSIPKKSTTAAAVAGGGGGGGGFSIPRKQEPPQQQPGGLPPPLQPYGMNPGGEGLEYPQGMLAREDTHKKEEVEDEVAQAFPFMAGVSLDRSRYAPQWLLRGLKEEWDSRVAEAPLVIPLSDFGYVPSHMKELKVQSVCLSLDISSLFDLAIPFTSHSSS